MRGWLHARFSSDAHGFPRERAQGDTRRRGMTLIELMVILGVLSLLTAWVVLAVRGLMDHYRGKPQRVAQDFKVIDNALRLHVEKTGRLPDPDTGLGTLVEQGLLAKLPQDPWGHDYRYVLLGEEAVIVSLGADGAPGGSGDDRDLSSRDLDTESAR
ncbi:type II secretion system protein GspG [Corallococcus praedator]|uniref:Type II secretion system protein GspG n=1 Tax=Corallococcus praedator TaxID=2316724 RepID=A0ABX9QGH8_9BACT|nr:MULTISPECIES: type II secretion system protein GspG [Corallococcus]RKH27245.1 type II secretion system protein GspG [Corallococcus sp. CA031C]RKI06878.1 type II secretion system protein GspG [Corallococcus praedator]